MNSSSLRCLLNDLFIKFQIGWYALKTPEEAFDDEKIGSFALDVLCNGKFWNRIFNDDLI